MANNSRTNPMQMDSVGDCIGVGSPVHISGIVVIASGDTWSAILKDGAGNVVFRADSDLTNHRSVYFAPAEPFLSTGLRLDTATDIALVLIYTVP
jgi:hypothetical protein